MITRQQPGALRPRDSPSPGPDVLVGRTRWDGSAMLLESEEPSGTGRRTRLDAAMRGHRPWVRRPAVATAVALATVATVWSSSVAQSASGVANPAASVAPVPDYINLCAPAGVDTSVTCLRLTLAAVDRARAREGIGPMRLPSDFAQLSVPEQLFVAIDLERVNRGLTPFVGLTVALDQSAERGADAAGLPPDPGHAYRTSELEWIGEVANGLDADYQWVYDDGPGSGLPDCSSKRRSGCWSDRRIVLGNFGNGRGLVMGAALDPTGDSSPGSADGPSLAATLAVARHPIGPFAYTWVQALSAMGAGTLAPLTKIPADESDTGIADPTHNVNPDPNYFDTCAPSGIDSSPSCVQAVLAAINHARALEGVRSMVLPADFPQLTVPEQLFVAINLERVDRGLAPFVGMTAALDRNAQRGADAANDPPDAGSAYLLVDDEWAGGSANGLDAVYGWMYDDGFNSGNLDCLHRGAVGCWGHRHGILDNFGSGNDLVMGTALNATGDTNTGDIGGTSMAATLGVATKPGPLLYTWADAIASLPAGATERSG